MRSRGGFALALLGAVVGAGGCIVKSPAGPTAVERDDYPSRTIELPNGLRVLLEQAPDFGAAGAVLVVGAGSADDPAGKAGLAHLAEHMVFDATHGGVSFHDWSRNLDGGVNAMTTWDTTTYYAFQRTRGLPEMLTFLSGVVTEPLAGIDDRVFEREWRAVSNERRRGTENGTPGQAEGWLIAASFPATTPYGHSVVGTGESLSKVTFDDVRAFVAAHYRPAACTLVVSAPLALNAQQALVESITGQKARLAATKPHGSPAAMPPRMPRSFETREADVANPTLWIGWPVPPDFGAGGDLAPLVAEMAGFASWSELGERDRDIATLRTGTLDGVAASLFFVRVTLNGAVHPADTARLVVDQLQGAPGRLSASGDSTAVLSQFVAMDFVYRQEELLSRVLDTAWSFHHLGRPTFLRTRAERMVKLTYADVAGYVQEFLTDDKAHAVLVRPGRSSDTDTSSPPPRAATPALVPAAASPPVPVVAPSGAPAVPESREEARTLAGMETRDLPNGLRVIVVRRSGSPFHTAVIGFRGGLAHATPPGVVTAMEWGRQSHETSPRLNGIDWSTRVSKDATFETLHATGRDVRLTLKHLHRMLRGFSMFWPPREFDKRVEALEREDRFPANEFHDRMDHAIYGTQPLGVSVTAKQMRRISPADVNRWTDRVRRPDNGVLVLVGDIEPEQAFDAAAAELGGWGAGTRAPAPPDDPRAIDRLGEDAGLLIQDRAGAKQVGLRIECLLPKASPENYAAEIVFADSMKRSLLGSLREEIGASYSVVGGVEVLPGGSAVLDIGADVDYGMLVPVLRQVRHVLAPAGPVPGADRLESTRRGTAGRFGIEGATSGLLAMRILKMWTLRWPIETLDKLPARARSASLADVTDIAEHCRASSVVGLLGDASRLRASWSASGGD